MSRASTIIKDILECDMYLVVKGSKIIIKKNVIGRAGEVSLVEAIAELVKARVFKPSRG